MAQKEKKDYGETDSIKAMLERLRRSVTDLPPVEDEQPKMEEAAQISQKTDAKPSVDASPTSETLSETENGSSYKEKIIKILDILFDGNENDFIAGIRKKASK